MEAKPETGAPVLPPLAPELAALVARYPLPEGVPDALLNKKLLANALDVSTTTIDTWATNQPDEKHPERGGLPYERKGTNGASYQFRLSVAFAWRQHRLASEAQERRLAEDASAQLRLELLGGSAADQSRASLPLSEQREAIRLEAEWMKAAALRRDLLRVDDAVEGVEAMLVAIRDGLDAAPDRIARELNLDGPATEIIQNALDAVLNEARARIENDFLNPDGD